jgi:predicted DNA-binding transcriptional regulator AlpA
MSGFEEMIRNMVKEEVSAAMAAARRQPKPKAEKEGLRPKEIQETYGLSAQVLANLRSQGRGPQYHKLGRTVVYSRSEIERYIASHRVKTFQGSD